MNELPYNLVPTPLGVDTVYNYIQSLCYGQDILDIDDQIRYAATQIFKQYPIWDESVREDLNKTILTTFLDRGIAYETYGRWRLGINNCMNIIMPKYNNIAKSDKMFTDENILGLKDTEQYQEETSHTRDTNGDYNTVVDSQSTQNSDQTSKQTDHSEQDSNTTQNQSTSDKQTNKYWDTPQSDLQGTGLQYATNITDVSQSSTVNQTTNTDQNTDSTQNEESHSDSQDTSNQNTDHEYKDKETFNHENQHQYTRYGNSGHQTQSLIKEYRELVISIFEEILKDPMLNDQFSCLLAI